MRKQGRECVACVRCAEGSQVVSRGLKGFYPPKGFKPLPFFLLFSLLPQVEQLLSDAKRLAPSWLEKQAEWRSLLQQPEVPLQHVAMLLAFLQRYTMPAIGGLTRQLFIREAKEHR